MCDCALQLEQRYSVIFFLSFLWYSFIHMVEDELLHIYIVTHGKERRLGCHFLYHKYMNPILYTFFFFLLTLNRH